MSCHALLTERNKLHYTIVDVLPVQTSVDIFNLEESDILLVMLGSIDQDIIQEFLPDLWSIMMFYIAKFMHPLYKKIQPVLISKVQVYFQYFQAIYFPQRLKLTDEQFLTIQRRTNTNNIDNTPTNNWR
jgi:hypothetical protein